MTKIVATSVLGLLLSACSSQQKVEVSAPAMDGMGEKHTHITEGFGDFIHQHSGNSTASHGHSWQQIQDEINKRKMIK